MVEKQPPLEPRVSPADPVQDPPVAPTAVSGEQPQEGIWELQPCRGIVGHRTPGKRTTRQGSPVPTPAQALTLTTHVPVVKTKPNHVLRLQVWPREALDARGDSRGQSVTGRGAAKTSDIWAG